MSALAAPTAAARPPTGAELAARIQIPRQLPLRYRHPRFYGLSPCEADPARLAALCSDAASALPPAPLAHAA